MCIVSTLWNGVDRTLFGNGHFTVDIFIYDNNCLLLGWVADAPLNHGGSFTAIGKIPYWLVFDYKNFHFNQFSLVRENLHSIRTSNGILTPT